MIEPANKYMSSYECPAGSCIIFTESLCAPLPPPNGLAVLAA